MGCALYYTVDACQRGRGAIGARLAANALAARLSVCLVRLRPGIRDPHAQGGRKQGCGLRCYCTPKGSSMCSTICPLVCETHACARTSVGLRGYVNTPHPTPPLLERAEQLLL